MVDEVFTRQAQHRLVCLLSVPVQAGDPSGRSDRHRWTIHTSTHHSSASVVQLNKLSLAINYPSDRLTIGGHNGRKSARQIVIPGLNSVLPGRPCAKRAKGHERVFAGPPSIPSASSIRFRGRWQQTGVCVLSAWGIRLGG